MGEPGTRVYFGDLPLETDEATATSIFGAYGNIKYCKILEGKGACIIEFQSPDEARWIVENLNGNIAQGLSGPVRVEYARPFGGAGGCGGKGGAWTAMPGPGYGGGGGGGGGCARWSPYPAKGGGKGKGGGSISVLKKGLQYAGVLPGGKWNNDQNALFVSGLPADTTCTDLYDIFCPFGAIPSQGAYAACNPDGSCKGIGFINYLEPSSAQTAINTLNGTIMPDGSTLRVQPKGPSKKPRPGGVD